MDEFVIKALRDENTLYRIRAKNHIEAIEIFKEYGQYQYSTFLDYVVCRVSYENFHDMVREDLILIEEFN